MKIHWLWDGRVGIVVVAGDAYVFAVEIYQATKDALVFSPELMEFSREVFEQLSAMAEVLVETGVCSRVYGFISPELSNGRQLSSPYIEFRIKSHEFDIRKEIGTFAANEIVRVAFEANRSLKDESDAAVKRAISDLLRERRYADAVAFASIFGKNIEPLGCVPGWPVAREVTIERRG